MRALIAITGANVARRVGNANGGANAKGEPKPPLTIR